MPRFEIPELLPLRKGCGLILTQIYLSLGIDRDSFFVHLACQLGHESDLKYTRSYEKRIPQVYLLDRFSTFVQCVDRAVKACCGDETIINRQKISENWVREREKFLNQLYQKNEEARTIVLDLRQNS